MELLSEEEQWDALKRWLKTNGPSILIMVALALLAYFGWKWWQDQQDQKAREAGQVYAQVLAEFDAGNVEVALAAIDRLHKDYAGSAYEAPADLAAAHIYVVGDEIEKAVPFLERVSNSAKDASMRNMGRLRLARVQSAMGEHDKALATLGTQDMGSFQSAFLEARGDVLFAKGDRAGALKEYEAARALLTAESAGSEGVGPILDLKISDLKATT